MFKAAQLFLIMILSGNACAQSNHLVAIVNFDCQYCQEAYKFYPMIKNKVEGEGGRFVVAPLPTSIDHDFRERFYYEADSINKVLGQMVLQVLFHSAESKFKINDPEELASLLTIEHGDEIPWQKIAQRVMTGKDKKGRERLGKAINLAREKGVVGYPSYIVFSGSKSELVLTNGDSLNQIKNVLKHFER